MTKGSKTTPAPRKFISAYGPAPRVRKHFPLPSLAKQSFRDECDINWIMARFEKTGLVNHLNTHQGNYGSFIGFEDYHTSMNQILAAETSFMTLPARVRAKFENDAAEFLRFAQDPKNLPEMVEMGLAHKRPSEAVEEAPPPQVPVLAEDRQPEPTAS